MKIQPFIDKYFKLKIKYSYRFRLHVDLKSPLALFKRSIISMSLIIAVGLLYALSFWISQYSMIIAIPFVLAGSAIGSIFDSKNLIDILIEKIGFTILLFGMVAFVIRIVFLPEVWFPEFLDSSLYAPIIIFIIGCFFIATGTNMPRTKWKEASDEWLWNE